MNDTVAKYDGSCQACIARCKKVLKAAGFAWGTIKGRYSPFDNQQRVTKGIRAHRVGCSNNVAVGAIGYTHSDGYEEARMMETLAIVTLRDAGLPIDDRGWIVCAY